MGEHDTPAEGERVTASTDGPKVYILANPDKPEARATLETITPFVKERAELVGTACALDGQPAIKAGADCLVVIGGDGTLIGVARSLAGHPLPILGINVGKLGFLAEFSIEEFRGCFDQAVGDAKLISQRMALDVTMRHDGEDPTGCIALNDCVIQAGPPFRPVTLGVFVDGIPLTEVTGDGLIVCTPTGSTAHNLSAGGPILQQGVAAIVLTPLAPHSLTHRPLVIKCDSTSEVRASETNEGTTAIVDGQCAFPMAPGDTVIIKRHAADVQVIRNPLYAQWHKLITKLHWGEGPTYR